jgi:hypothetical protein
MPRPPILPTVDWRALFADAKDFETWLASGESPENQEKMRGTLAELTMPPDVASFLQALPRPVHVIAIAEDWCGDVVRHVPVLMKMAEHSPRLRVRFIAREDSPETFVRFLTNGGEAIPKFVFLSEDFVECGNWGPMPNACREYIARGKACGDGKLAREFVGDKYKSNADRQAAFEELARLADIAASPSPNPKDSLLAKA